MSDDGLATFDCGDGALGRPLRCWRTREADYEAPAEPDD